MISLSNSSEIFSHHIVPLLYPLQVLGKEKGFEVGKSIGHFRANSKALAENEGDGIAKVLHIIHTNNKFTKP